MKVGTDRMLRYCREHDKPVLAFVNAVDRERADFQAAVDSLGDVNPVVVTLPIGSESSFAGFVDLIAMKAVRFTGEGQQTRPTLSEIPDELLAEARRQRHALEERVAEFDDEYADKVSTSGPALLKINKRARS